MALPTRALQLTAAKLDDWAERRDSQSALPILARRLVHSTTADIHRNDFGGGDSVALGGWDGVVECVSGNAWVRPGRSLWELSVDKKVKKKADDDYDKRSAVPGDVDPAQSTFVFLTLRKWGGKKRWAATRRAEGVWADVRAYDADDVEQWLEVAPAVHAWALRQSGRDDEHYRDIESFWHEWAQGTKPPLSPAVLLSGRQNQVERIRAWLEGAPSPLFVQAPSVDEAMAFVAAALLSMSSDRRDAIVARTLVVRRSAAPERLGVSRQPLVIGVAAEDQTSMITWAALKHHVFVALDVSVPALPEVLRVRRFDQAALENELMRSGVPKSQAETLARECRGYLGPIRRALASVPAVRAVPWGPPLEGPALVPLLLVGAWDESRPADVEAIGRVAERTYPELSPLLLRWLNEPEPPLRRDGTVWQWIARTDAWTALARFIDRPTLERFESLTLSILAAPDPRYELPADERWLAAVKGKLRAHSPQLLRSLAEGVALLGCLPESAAILGGTGGQRRAMALGRSKRPPEVPAAQPPQSGRPFVSGRRLSAA